MEIINRIKNNIKFKWANVSFKLKRCWYILCNDHQFDYAYLLMGERMKIEHMLWYYKNYTCIDDASKIVKDLELCLMYIDMIYNEEDLDGKDLNEDGVQDALNTYNDIRNRMLYWWD